MSFVLFLLGIANYLLSSSLPLHKQEKISLPENQTQ